MAVSPFLAWSFAEAELGFPVSMACPTAPARGKAARAAASSNEREIEIIAISFSRFGCPVVLRGAVYETRRGLVRLWIPHCGTRRIDVLRLDNAKDTSRHRQHRVLTK